MFLKKWTVQLSCPGQIIERAFDSEKEVAAFVREMERKSNDGVRPTFSVLDPEGKEKPLASVEDRDHTLA